MIVGKFKEEEGGWCSRASREAYGVAFGRRFRARGRNLTTELF